MALPPTRYTPAAVKAPLSPVEPDPETKSEAIQRRLKKLNKQPDDQTSEDKVVNQRKKVGY